MKTMYSWSSPKHRWQLGPIPPTPQAASWSLMMEARTGARAETPLGVLAAKIFICEFTNLNGLSVVGRKQRMGLCLT